MVLGLGLHNYIKNVLFGSPQLICWALIAGGLVLLALDRFDPKPRHTDAMRYPLWTSLGIGLFLARGNGKPRDLEIKLTALEMTPQAIDYLILLRHDDDISLTGKSKTIWQDSERKGLKEWIGLANECG